MRLAPATPPFIHMLHKRGKVNHLIKPLPLSTKPCVPALKCEFHHSLFAAASVHCFRCPLMAVLPGCVITLLCPGLFQSAQGGAGWVRCLGTPPVPSPEEVLLFTSDLSPVTNPRRSLPLIPWQLRSFKSCWAFFKCLRALPHAIWKSM